jgi:hypothetical protein
VKLLEGDAQLIELVENKKISATKARKFINEHGADEATKYALAHINMKSSPVVTTTENNEQAADSGELNSQATSSTDKDRVAAKSHTKNVGLQMRSLSTGKAKECESIITQMAQRVSEDGTIKLPQVLLEKLVTLASDISEIDKHNTDVLKMTEELKNQ